MFTKADLGRLFALQEAQRYSVDEDRIKVSLWVSIKVIVADVLYDLEIPPAIQVIEYTQ